jgi:hypothetical protein
MGQRVVSAVTFNHTPETAPDQEKLPVPVKVPARPPEKMRRPENRNAIRSGTFSFLASGRWPKGAGYVSRLTRGLRVALEAAVRERHGDVSVYHGCLIQTAERSEARSLLLQKWLRDAPDLTTAERVSILHGITGASEARDRAVAKLGIDRNQGAEILAILYGTTNPGAEVVDHLPRTDET